MNLLAKRYNELFATHNTVDTIVHAEACPGMPDYLKGPTCLRIGLNMPIPVDPLRVEDEGITAGLSFGRRKHEVFIPWTAFIGARDGEDVLLVGPGNYIQPEPVQPKADGVKRPAVRSEGNVWRVDFAARRRRL